eukprot:scpid61374/ scgid21731/ 
MSPDIRSLMCHQLIRAVFMMMLILPYNIMATPLPGCPQVSNRKLLRWLGSAGRRHLQHFTPMSLCLRSNRERAAAALSASSSFSQQHQSAYGTAVSLEDWTENHSTRLDMVRGCTSPDLNQLMSITPDIGSRCSWNLECDYDADRFPAILYTAKKTFTSMVDIQRCDCSRIRRNVFVLRRRRDNNGCLSWNQTLQLETITIGYTCRY